jgi:mannose PTS system EIIA component
MTPLVGVVVGHGRIAAALIDAVEQISGSGSGLVAISNTDCDRGSLDRLVHDAVDGHPAIVFVDMPSGSCHIAVMRQLKSLSNVRVVTGVNLAMLLEFVFHRDGAVDEVAERLAAAGAHAVTAP